MKTLLGTKRYILVIGGILACAAIFAYAKPQKPDSRKVDIHEQGIVIHPTIKLQSQDQTKLDAVLKKYDKEVYLYRIDTLKKGKIVQTRGTCDVLDALKPEIARAQAAGYSDDMDNSACPQWSGCPSANFTTKEIGLVEELKLILKSY